MLEDQSQAILINLFFISIQILQDSSIEFHKNEKKKHFCIAFIGNIP